MSELEDCGASDAKIPGDHVEVADDTELHTIMVSMNRY